MILTFFVCYFHLCGITNKTVVDLGLKKHVFSSPVFNHHCRMTNALATVPVRFVTRACDKLFEHFKAIGSKALPGLEYWEKKLVLLRKPGEWFFLIGRLKNGTSLRRQLKNSASADGGPRSRVCACQILRSAPHRQQRKFSATRVCRVTIKHLPQLLRTHIQRFKDNF